MAMILILCNTGSFEVVNDTSTAMQRAGRLTADGVQFTSLKLKRGDVAALRTIRARGMPPEA